MKEETARLGLCVLELFAMYAKDDRQVDGLTDGQMIAYCPLPYGRGHNDIVQVNNNCHI